MTTAATASPVCLFVLVSSRLRADMAHSDSEFGDYVKYSSSVNGGSGCMSIQQKVADGDVSTVTTPAVAPEQTAN